MSTSMRTLPFIMLISPMGTVVNAKWADDERSYEKSVQRDKYPLLHGETAIDFGGGADAYNITLIFDGPDCDLTAAQFYEAAKEFGPWMVTHPLHGIVQLQLLTIRERVTPVSGGGRFEIETTWMEPLDPLTMMTLRQLTGAIDAQLAGLSAASGAAMAGATVIDGAGSIGNIAAVAGIASAAANTVAGKMYTIAGVAASLALAKSQTAQAQLDLTNAITAAQSSSSDLDCEAIATAMFSMFQGPVLCCSDATAGIGALTIAAQSVAASLPTMATRTSINRAQTAQVVLEAIVGASCLAATMGTLQTRTQAIGAARALADLLYYVTSEIDDAIDLFATSIRPDHRFYAQTETYESALLLVSSCVKYLIQQSFDLRIEKWITLDRDKTPIQICAEEYGAKGEETLDDFIDWNQLEGDDVMILAQSREVVLYVEPRR